MRMFTDRHVDAILCVRGGYGTSRLLPLLDYRAIRENAKVLVGYSDITSLHCALLVKADMVSFHGPMLNSDFASDEMPRFTLHSFLRTLGFRAGPDPEWPGATGRSRTEPLGGNTANGYRGNTVRILRRGVAQGQLIGGNLTLLCATVGTPWQPPFRGRILFFEDLNEEPYRLDRMLTQLLSCRLLQQLAGVAIGINRGCEDPKAAKLKEYRQSAEDVFRERLLPLNIPIVAGLPFGHVRYNATLPIGSRAVLDGNRGQLMLTEPPVR